MVLVLHKPILITLAIVPPHPISNYITSMLKNTALPPLYYLSYTTPSLIISISLISLGCQHIHSHPLTPILYWLTTFYHGNHRCWLYYLYPGIYTRPLAELLNLNPRIHI
jgi:hypothetical protein